jgi:ribosomal protein S18 acetylase RimI-like enzyme
MIEFAKPEDAERIAEIQVFGWRSAYRGIVSDHHLFSVLTVAKRAVVFRDVIIREEQFRGSVADESGSDQAGSTYVLREDGIVKAFLCFGPCRDSDMKGVFELWGIYVEPAMKRQGIGARLVEFCHQEAVRLGYSSIVLWVFRDNNESRGFYEKMGYQVQGSESFMENLETFKVRYICSL